MAAPKPKADAFLAGVPAAEETMTDMPEEPTDARAAAGKALAAALKGKDGAAIADAFEELLGILDDAAAPMDDAEAEEPALPEF